MDYKDKKSLLRINSARFYSYGWITEYLKNFSACEILKKTPLEISFETGISFQKAESFLKKAASFDAEKEMEKAEKYGFSVFFYGEKNYPDCFYQIPQPPMAVYLKGVFSSFTAVAVVGTRKADAYAVKQTESISFSLAQSGMGIISGLARGVDTLAHKAALKAKGKTAAVIGSGLSNIYPAENKKLAEEICSCGGFILSESPLEEEPLKQNFPLRNRLISALSWGVLVIRGDYPSGSLITARHALTQGKEVMAVPGNIDNPLSNGPNKLIKEGAVPIISWTDVLDAAPEYIRRELIVIKSKKNKKAGEELEEQLKKIFYFISLNEGITCDEISCGLSMPVSQVLTSVFELESGGFVASKGGRYYCIK
ncbi:MAG: DNA-protecting protein DprA [Elusimicrobia bacterium]|nr:DNA-protecting protein DprA [Elusimicrobiota bacterium]